MPTGIQISNNNYYCYNLTECAYRSCGNVASSTAGMRRTVLSDISNGQKSESRAAPLILLRSCQTQASTDSLVLPRYACLCSCEPAILTNVREKLFCVDVQ